MTFRRIVSASLTLRKSLISCLAATLLAAPAVAQTLDDQLIKNAYDTDALMRRINAAKAAAEQLANESNAGGDTTPASSQPVSVDAAVWGVFAKLAGHRWQTADEVIRVFEWSRDGRELVESEIVGGLPQPQRVYAIQDNELVQHECVSGIRTCIRFQTRFGTVADDGSVVFKEIMAVGKGKNPSVALRERPVADWNSWKRKYSLIGEAVISYELVGTDQLEVTQSFSGKRTEKRAEDSWGGSVLVPTIAYSRVSDGSAQSEFVATTDFGPMELFAGKRMISEDSNEILELQHLPDGSMAIQWFSLWGQPIGRYVFVIATNGGLELRDYPYANSQDLKMQSKSVGWLEGGNLSFRTQLEGSGYSLSHIFSLSNGKLQANRYDTEIGKTLLGKSKVKDFSAVTRTFIPATPEMIAAAVEAHERRLEAQRRQAEREAQERREREAQSERDFARFMGGLNTFANAYNDAMAESRANEARQQAFLEDLREQTEEIDRSRVAQQQADAEAQRSALAEERARAGSEVPKQAASVQQNQVAKVARTSTQSRSEPSRERQTSLIETPEAIVVCTRPDDKGRFQCDTPVDVNFRGGPKPGDLWRTPEEFVAQADSCADARRLHSATHLVWGCGYGATNGGNTMDRSAGVDVKGRNTYYCAAREWPCRRTTPQ